jgi:fucose permease
MIRSLRQPFVRGRFTWLAYALLACYCYLQVTPGAVIPFLHTELHLNYTLDSLHLSSLSIGAILAGFSSTTLVAWLGRRGVLWLGAVGMLSGVFLLFVSHVVFLSIISMFLMGLLGSLTMICAQSALADYYGEQRAIALTEANTATSLAASLAPLCLGVLLALGAGWRSMLAVPVVGVLLLLLFFRTVAIPECPRIVHAAVPEARSLRTGSPPAFWLYWGVLVLAVSAEWAISFWSAGFLIHVVGLARDFAATMVSLFFLAEVIGRFAGSWLTRRFSAESLLYVSLGVAAGGFVLFWLDPLPAFNIAGLFVAGLGIANLFPLSFALSVQQIPQQADLASARGALGGGIAVAAAPFMLGRVADMVGLRSASGLVLILLALACVTLYLARRMARGDEIRSALPLSEAALLEPLLLDGE